MEVVGLIIALIVLSPVLVLIEKFLYHGTKNSRYNKTYKPVIASTGKRMYKRKSKKKLF